MKENNKFTTKQLLVVYLSSSLNTNVFSDLRQIVSLVKDTNFQKMAKGN